METKWAIYKAICWNLKLQQTKLGMHKRKKKKGVRIVVKFDWKSLTYVVNQNCKWEK